MRHDVSRPCSQPDACWTTERLDYLTLDLLEGWWFAIVASSEVLGLWHLDAGSSDNDLDVALRENVGC